MIYAFEGHSPGDIRAALKAGVDPVANHDGKSPIVHLIEMYTRSPRFAECLQVMLDAGATINDPALESILLDDPSKLGRALEPDCRFSLQCTFTPLEGVSPLHVCAEYNSVRCAEVLLQKGANVNTRAALDEQGCNGHTPLFHTVNSNRNFARPMLELLCDAGAETDLRLKALVWGRGFEWETTIFDVTPMSYAQCGLYSQFSRAEGYIYDNISYLHQKRYGTEPLIRNVPNKYLDDARLFPPRM